MASQINSFEVYGKENVPQHGALVLSNRLEPDDLPHLETVLDNRKIVYLIESGKTYDAKVLAYLDEDLVEALEFVCQDEHSESFQKALRECIDQDGFAVLVPGQSKTRPGQTVAIPSRLLNFVIRAQVPLLPLSVDHPGETCLSTENPDELPGVVFSFGDPLSAEEASLANFTENLLIAAEAAFAQRPILNSHLAYELIKGLKKHGASSQIIDGMDEENPLRYDKLLAAAIAFSKVLAKSTTKSRIGVILPPGKAGLLSNLAVLFAGKTPVNLNFTAGSSAIKSCIDQADLDKFITAGPFVAKLKEFDWPDENKLIMVDKVLPPLKKNIVLWLLISKFTSADSLARKLKIPQRGGHDEAILLFTSGSSGMPKGVVLSHRNILANVNQFGCRIDLEPEDSVLGCLPLFHSFGCTVTMWYPIVEGVNLVTYPSPLDTGRLAELVEKYKVNLVLATPTFLRGYLRKASKEQFQSVKMVITGAEKLPSKVADAFKKRFGKTVYEGYGLTETSPVTNVNLPELAEDDSEEVPLIPNYRAGSVGLFIPGVAVRITDPETGDPLPLDSSGMIWLKGANIFEEYLGQQEKTAEVKKGDWFVTGDIGRVDEDGFLYIEGRLSRFSKIAGEMVPHETVESSINQALGMKDDERQIAVVGLPDEAKGEILILLSSAELDQADLRKKLLETGIPALWVPKKIIKVDEIPMLASGKLDIKGCEDRAKGDA